MTFTTSIFTIMFASSSAAAYVLTSEDLEKMIQGSKDSRDAVQIIDQANQVIAASASYKYLEVSRMYRSNEGLLDTLVSTGFVTKTPVKPDESIWNVSIDANGKQIVYGEVNAGTCSAVSEIAYSGVPVQHDSTNEVDAISSISNEVDCVVTADGRYNVFYRLI